MVYYSMGLIMGFAIAMQTPINAALGRSLQTTPLVATLISFIVGSLCLLLLVCLSGDFSIDTIKSLPKQNWWKFLGGILGAFCLFGMVWLVPKIGLVHLFLFMLVGQLIMGTLLDHFGAFGLNIKPISWHKILGLGIIFVGLLVFFIKELKEKF